MASRRCSSPPPSSSTISPPPSAKDALAKRSLPSPIPTSWWSMKSDTSHMALTLPTCSSMSSTIATNTSAPWSSPPTKRSKHGALCCTTRISRTPSLIASSSVAEFFTSTALRCAPGTSALTTSLPKRYQLKRAEFPELGGQNFRNPQEQICAYLKEQTAIFGDET